MGKKGNSVSVALPETARLVVPVMAATGGSARSTVAHLLADELAAAADTVVLDLAPRLASPWHTWSGGDQVPGLAGLPPDQPLTRRRIRDAAAVRQAPAGQWGVLTDGREWHSAPLNLPPEPAAWYQLAAAGGWQAVVADTAHPIANDVLVARCSGSPSLTRAWCDLPFAVPILCAQATADGMQTLQQAVMVLHAEGLPLQRTVVVLAATADGRPPAVVRAAATMLSARTAAVVHLPTTRTSAPTECRPSRPASVRERGRRPGSWPPPCSLPSANPLATRCRMLRSPPRSLQSPLPSD